MEMRYVSEWCSREYPDDWIRLNQYVGTWVPLAEEWEVTPAEHKMMSVRRGRCDALVIRKEELIVIEGKLRPERYADALMKLKIYVRLVPVTPELEEHKALPVHAILLTPVLHPVINDECHGFGFKNVIWSPKWVTDYLLTLKPYLRGVPRYE